MRRRECVLLVAFLVVSFLPQALEELCRTSDPDHECLEPGASTGEGRIICEPDFHLKNQDCFLLPQDNDDESIWCSIKLNLNSDDEKNFRCRIENDALGTATLEKTHCDAQRGKVTCFLELSVTWIKRSQTLYHTVRFIGSGTTAFETVYPALAMAVYGLETFRSEQFSSVDLLAPTTNSLFFILRSSGFERVLNLIMFYVNFTILFIHTFGRVYELSKIPHPLRYGYWLLVLFEFLLFGMGICLSICAGLKGLCSINKDSITTGYLLIPNILTFASEKESAPWRHVCKLFDAVIWSICYTFLEVDRFNQAFMSSITALHTVKILKCIWNAFAAPWLQKRFGGSLREYLIDSASQEHLPVLASDAASTSHTRPDNSFRFFYTTLYRKVKERLVNAKGFLRESICIPLKKAWRERVANAKGFLRESIYIPLKKAWRVRVVNAKGFLKESICIPLKKKWSEYFGEYISS